MIKTIRGFMKRLNEDHVGAYAAQSAYFILLSFIPFVLLVVTLVKYTPLTRDDVYSVLINMLPTEFQSYVGGIVNEIFYQSVAYMPITIITTLWSAGKGIAALTNGLNSIYHVTETRNQPAAGHGIYLDICRCIPHQSGASGLRNPHSE